jgi:arylsulfatase A-like enzyme
VASHFGGTRNPLVIVWPDRIKDAGGVRTQFHHVIDISPTILEAAHLPQPTEVNGVKQKPIEGVSMVYSFDDPKATDTRQIQYFEMFGNRALYKDGWIATARHDVFPGRRWGHPPETSIRTNGHFTISPMISARQTTSRRNMGRS